MIWLWIGLGILSAFMFLVFMGACKLGAEMDRHTEIAFRQMMESRSQNDVDGSLHEADGLSQGEGVANGQRK